MELSPPDLSKPIADTSGAAELLRAMADCIDGKPFDVSPMWDLFAAMGITSTVATELMSHDYYPAGYALRDIYEKLESASRAVSK